MRASLRSGGRDHRYSLDFAKYKCRFVCARSSASSGFGLSPTEARPGEAPNYNGVDTEARREFRLTTSVAPTDASKNREIVTADGSS